MLIATAFLSTRKAFGYTATVGISFSYFCIAAYFASLYIHLNSNSKRQELFRKHISQKSVTVVFL